MGKKKGFTLVELLAVIVILAIIALIATPIILNVIEDAKKGAAKASALGYLDAVEKQIAIDQMDTTKASVWANNTYTNLNEEPLSRVQVKGKKPTSVSITIENKQIKGYTIIVDGYKITLDYEGNITVEKGDETDQDNNVDINYTCSGDNCPKCVRATTLHTEECTQTSTSAFCSGAGYTGAIITYGNDPSTRTTGALTSGDAFDCDVNGDGTYDATTERFYYVSDLASNSNYAVLIYYKNTTAGVADNTASSLIAYDSSGENWHGPVTAIANLPTTTQWSNISLASTTRSITNESGGNTTTGGTLPTAFSYEGKAARLLTAQEINDACGITVGSATVGELDNCSYLMENTKYASSSMGTNGYWLETPNASYSGYAWVVQGHRYVAGYASVIFASPGGVRPAIEILKSNISY